jgi:hypothetical protein
LSYRLIHDHVEFGGSDGGTPDFFRRKAVSADIQAAQAFRKASRDRPASSSAPSTISPLQPEKQSK